MYVQLTNDYVGDAVFGKYLTSALNKCIDERGFPHSFNVAIVFRLYQKRNKAHSVNYQLTGVLCSAIEDL